MDSVDNNNCISYTPSSLELILPSPIVFSTLCVSTDKTSLFINSFIRLMFYVILYYFLNDMIDMNKHRIVQYILFTMIMVNILYIGVVVSKTTIFSIGTDQSMFPYTKGGSVQSIPSS